MKLAKTAEKLAKYYRRLEDDGVERIKPEHVERVLKKLHKKLAKIQKEERAATDDDKRDRLRQKLGVIQEQLDRAEWLRREIAPPDDA